MKWLRRGARALCAAVFAAVLLACVPGAAHAVFIPEPTVGRVASANPSNLTPHARDGEVRAFAEIGNTIYVGGTFSQIRPDINSTWTARPYLFAYDRLTGAISTSFAPTLDGAVNALAVNAAGQLIVGGAFRNVNGAERRNLVALNAATGATVGSWSGRSDGGVVRTLKVSGSSLYVGGAFNWLNGVERRGLARINAATGAIDPAFVVHATEGRNNVSSYVWTLDVTPDGRTLMIGGNFTLVAGEPRNQIAMIELDESGVPALADWQTTRYVSPCGSPDTFTHYVQDIDFSDDGSYFVVGSNGGRGWPNAYCDMLVRFETAARGTGQDATWVDLTGNDTITSVEATDEVIYTGGHFRWLNNPNRSDAAGSGAVDRLGIGAADPNNGMPINWNPRRSGAPAGTTAWGSAVPVIWRGSDGIYVGQNSDGLGNEYHGRFGMFPLSSGRNIPIVRPPVEESGFLYSGGTEGELTRTPIAADGTLGEPEVVAQPNFTGTGFAARAGDKLYWDVAGQFGISSVAGNGAIGAPWHVGYNEWFNSSLLTGGFYLNGRLYYTRSTGTGLYYRYLEPDGYIVGATEFSLPTTGMTWSTVRGLAWINGALVFGTADGALRTVPFDPTAAGGLAVDGANVTELAPAPTELEPGPSWTSRTLFFAGS